MPSELPRRLIEELLARWTLAGLQLAVVEGPSDQRFFSLIGRESYCDPKLRGLDTCCVETLEVPQTIVAKHGLSGTGAKQRVIALMREIAARGVADGFRGIVDRDIDLVLKVDFRSPCLLYTDHGCLDGYVWSVQTLDRLVVQFHCEETIHSARAVSGLFASICNACTSLAAVRVASRRDPTLDITMHRSEKALSVAEEKIAIDLNLFVEQCKPAKGKLREAQAAVQHAFGEIAGAGCLPLLNGHDLSWLLTFALRKATSLNPRLISEEVVHAAMVAIGVSNPVATSGSLFRDLREWIRS